MSSDRYHPYPSWLNSVEGSAPSGSLSINTKVCQLAMTPTPSVPMEVHCFGEPSMLYRTCVDCGLYTGCYCDYCQAADRMPTAAWAAGQMTPLCSHCDRKHDMCHYCRQTQWCVPPPKGNPNPIPPTGLSVQVQNL